MLEVRTTSLTGTYSVAAALAEVARAGDLIVLAGEMGAGKTAFAQGFGKALGITEPITSPTFTLVHSYDTGRIELHHADLYRLERTAEVADLALGELLESKGIVLVEWGDVVSSSLGDHLEVRLTMAVPEAAAEQAGDDELAEDALDAGEDALDTGEDALDTGESVDADGDGATLVDVDLPVDAEEFGAQVNERLITIRPVGSSWAPRWARLEAALLRVGPC